jgi:hypothetical protein
MKERSGVNTPMKNTPKQKLAIKSLIGEKNEAILINNSNFYNAGPFSYIFSRVRRQISNKRIWVMKYFIENDETEVEEWHAESHGVMRRFNRGMFVKLEYDEDSEDYTYSYKHGMGEGKLVIPGHIFMDLQVMATLISLENDRLTQEYRIYKGKPIAHLNKKGKK